MTAITAAIAAAGSRRKTSQKMLKMEAKQRVAPIAISALSDEAQSKPPGVARVFRRRMTARVECYQIIDADFGYIQHYGYAGGNAPEASKPLQHNRGPLIGSLAFIHIKKLRMQIECSQ